MKYLSILQFVAAVLIASFSVGAVDTTSEKVAFDHNASTSPVQPEDPSNLLEGAMLGDEVRVRRALEDGEDVDDCNSNGWSAALFAVSHGDMYILEILIEAGIDLNLHADDGTTPLMLAAKQGDKEMVELMLHGNADPTMVNSKNETALMLANSSGRKIVSLALAEATVLFHLHNDEENAHSSHILEGVHNGAYINIQSTSGWTPVIFAAAKGHLKELAEMVGLGGNLHHVEKDGWSALHFAAHNGHAETCEYLLNNKCSASGTNDEGITPIQLAETAGHTNIVTLLQKYVAATDL